MASQDETPTQRSTAGGEPPRDAAASVPPAGVARTGSGSHAVPSQDPSGTNEHSDWEAEFDNLTGTERAEAEAAAEEQETADDAVENADDAAWNAGDTDAKDADTDAAAWNAGDTDAKDADDDAAARDADDDADAWETDADTDAQTRYGNPSAPVPAEDRAEPRTSSAAGAGGTVPGGHPSVAQRSHLPMRRASTLPDLSGYASLRGEEATDEAAGKATDKADDAADSTRNTGTEAARSEDARPATVAMPVVAASGARESGRPQAVPSGSHEAGRHEAGAGMEDEHGTEDERGTDASGYANEQTDTVPSDTVHPVHPDKDAEDTEDTDTDTVHTDTVHTDTVHTDTAHTDTDTADIDILTGHHRDDHQHDDVDHNQVNEDGYEDDSHGDVDPAVSAAEAQRRAEEREKAAAGKPVLARVLQVMIAVFFPVMVLAAAIRAVATPLFLWVEYHRPGFPADSYGFSTDDRMTYGSYAVDYLLNWSGSRYLGDLVGDGGEPLYLDSEVSHMADVKTVLTVAFVAAVVMAVLSLFAGLYLSRRSPGGIRRSLFSGAVLTLVLVAGLVVLAVLGWEQFFTQLHTIFFANGNWTFRMDDTLIRLFPAQFWMDAGIVIAALVLLTCAVVIACCWPTRARRERVLQAREDARRRYDESLEAL